MATRKNSGKGLPSEGGSAGSSADSGPVQVLAVQSEDEAVRLLQKALAEEFGDEQVRLSLKDWPKFTLKLEGQGYNSTITPDVAEVLVKLQHVLNRAYARAIHHSSNARSLTAEERKNIQFKAKVEKGSSFIEVNLGDFAEKLATALIGKMEPHHIVITVLGLALTGASLMAWKAWLAHKSEDNKVEAGTKEKIQLSQEETARHRILAEALTKNNELRHASEDFNDLRREVLRAVGDARVLAVQGMEFSNSEARSLANTPRTQSEVVQLNGHYLIEKIDWQHLDAANHVRVSLRNTDLGISFLASLNAQDLDSQQRGLWQSAEWDRKPLYMAVNATRLRGEVVSATIVTVEWPKDRKG